MQKKTWKTNKNKNFTILLANHNTIPKHKLTQHNSALQFLQRHCLQKKHCPATIVSVLFGMRCLLPTLTYVTFRCHAQHYLTAFCSTLPH